MSYAGWLLAELSLILMIVMIGSEAPLAAKPAEQTPTSTPTPTPTPTVAVGLARKPLEIDASLSKGFKAAAESLHKQIKRKEVRPAFILLWGVGDSTTGPEKSRAVAPRLQDLLEKTFADANTQIRAYYHGPRAGQWEVGRIYAEVFYFND